MSRAANIKAISQSQGDASVSSSLPLPRGMIPLSKMDPKQQHSGLPSPTVQYQHSTKRQPACSSLSASSGPADLLRGAALKNHLLQQKTSMYSRGPAATKRTDGTCSAYSSPQIPKREAPRSKDTLDLRSSTLTQKALRDLHLRRNTNKNWTFGKYRLRSVDNAQEDDASRPLPANAQSRGRLLYSKGANGNEAPSRLENFQKEVRNISNQDPEASDGQMFSNKLKSSHQTVNMARRRSEPGGVNMAAVAPFRFR